MKVSVAKFGMLICLNKTLDEFEDGPSETSLRWFHTQEAKKSAKT